MFAEIALAKELNGNCFVSGATFMLFSNQLDSLLLKGGTGRAVNGRYAIPLGIYVEFPAQISLSDKLEDTAPQSVSSETHPSVPFLDIQMHFHPSAAFLGILAELNDQFPDWTDGSYDWANQTVDFLHAQESCQRSALRFCKHP